MAAEDVFRKVRAIRWDGSNGAEVAAVCDGIAVDEATWTVESEDAEAGVLNLRQAQSEVTYAFWPVYAHHPWVVVANDFGIMGRLTDDEYAALWTEADEVGTIVGVGRVPDQLLTNPGWVKKAADKMRASMYGGFGVQGVPTITKNSSTVTVQVDIRPKQPDDKYAAEAFLVGASVDTTITRVDRVSDSRVDVTVRNDGSAPASSAFVLVHVS